MQRKYHSPSILRQCHPFPSYCLPNDGVNLLAVSVAFSKPHGKTAILELCLNCLRLCASNPTEGNPTAKVIFSHEPVTDNETSVQRCFLQLADGSPHHPLHELIILLVREAEFNGTNVLELLEKENDREL